MEHWKDINGYEGLYQASSTGKIKSLDKVVACRANAHRTCKGKLLTPITDAWGYFRVCLHNAEGKQKMWFVHRLIANTFIENPNNLPEINHKDCNPQNNSVENLEYCDRYYNNHYDNAYRKRALKKAKPVLQYTIDGVFVKEWASATIAANENEFNKSNICSCCYGKKKTAYGYIWKFAD